MVGVQHPCEGCERQFICSIGQRTHCPRFTEHVQVLCRLRAHQRLARELSRLLSRQRASQWVRATGSAGAQGEGR